MWRIRNVLQLLTTYFLWFIVMPQNGSLLGYTRSMMLTYVLLSDLFSSVVLSSLTGEVGDEINKGDLSNYLLKPINYFVYWFFRDVGDKLMNISFAIPELIVFLLVLRPPFFVQTNILILLTTAFVLLEAVILYFFINFLLGLIGFWSSEVWAPRFILFMVLTFFSGGIFPLDILPKPVFDVFQLLPFTYLLFFPLKVYLGSLSVTGVLSGITISLVWIGILFMGLQNVWRKGLRVYTAQGK
ncbi:MAG: ABC-2 family transporter protein [Patescibacteria group bacterium]|nr:ABC-2 family transporter protein [Patescibacteria group bacterium]